jgi:hypothetical protein
MPCDLGKPARSVDRLCVDGERPTPAVVDMTACVSMSPRQSDNLTFLSEACELWEPDQSDIGYLARVFTQTSLPYKDPGDIPAWQRRNGALTLSVQPGPPTLLPDGTMLPRGYPYGTMPRLLLAWLSTEAVRTKRRELVFGESLADFLRQLGLASTGGQNGSIGRLRKHAERLFLATIFITYDAGWGHSRSQAAPGVPAVTRQAGARAAVASEYELWWSNRDPHQPALLPSYVKLTEEFFREVTESPVPISIPALRALKGSALRLDIYMWLTYRMSYLRRRSEVPWASLRFQFGSQMANTRSGRFAFQRDFEKHLSRVLAVYPEANVEVSPQGVVLLPSRTHVKPRHHTVLPDRGIDPGQLKAQY